MLKRFNVKCPYCEAVVSCEMAFGEYTHHQCVTCQECDLPFVIKYNVTFHYEPLGLADYMKGDAYKAPLINEGLKASMDALRESAKTGPKIDLIKIEQPEKHENKKENSVQKEYSIKLLEDLLDQVESDEVYIGQWEKARTGERSLEINFQLYQAK